MGSSEQQRDGGPVTIVGLRAENFKKISLVEVAGLPGGAVTVGGLNPVPGMSFSEDDVLLDGLPFAQASTARKLRASVAMALSRAGQLRVLLVKAGNDLDPKNLALLAELAAEHGAQVWVERVTDDPKSVTVFVEDGRS